MGTDQADGKRTFGQLVRHYRRAATLTQEELAERAGLEVSTIQGWENERHRRPQRQALDAFIAALSLSEEDADILNQAARSGRKLPQAPSESQGGQGDLSLLSSAPQGLLVNVTELPSAVHTHLVAAA